MNVICLLLLFAVSYMFCFNVPLLNSLSAKKEKKRRREKKKKKKRKKDHPNQNRINLVCQVKWKVEIS
jgi:cytochrome c biogenesis protein ResB